ncbi:Helix-turn-helix [bacterium A37T11]|nr:Helix-turn-helix [bacterium A37T11]
MSKKLKESAKVQFARQLKRYRETFDLTQKYLAKSSGITLTYISVIEKGDSSVGLDILEKLANFFGVEYYEMGNPNFPVPSFDALPQKTKRAIAQLEKEKLAAAAKAAQKKAEDKKDGKPGRAKQLHTLIANGFFDQAQTAKNTFKALHPNIPEADYAAYTVEIGKITNTLSSGKFEKLLDKLEPIKGSTAVRFIRKGVDKIAAFHTKL